MERIIRLSLGIIVSFSVGFFAGQQTFLTEALITRKNIHTVSAAGDYKATREFLDRGVSPNYVDTFSQTPILHASWWGHCDIVKLLISRGADVNAQSTVGFTALYWAVNHGHYEIAELLLKAGAKPNVYSLNNWTPLHEAAVHNDNNLYDLLVNYGADENIQDCWGQTPRDLKMETNSAA